MPRPSADAAVSSGDGVTLTRTAPSSIGPAEWKRLAGPWEIDYSWANMRAVEQHPFNDSDGERSLWWEVRDGGARVGLYHGYITETYNFATLFVVGVGHRLSSAADRVYLALNRAGVYRHLHRLGLARWIRLASGRSRVLFLIPATGDVGGHGVGPRLRAEPARYLPALVEAMDSVARDHAVEQITIRDAAERDAGPFTFPDLWDVRDRGGERILAGASYGRDPGFPPAFLDLRAAAALRPNDGDLVYAVYRHDTEAEFLEYETTRKRWLREWCPAPHDDARNGQPWDVVAAHPRSRVRADAARVNRFRNHLFRSGIMPPALVLLAQLDRAEGDLTNADRTAARVTRLRLVVDALEAELDAAASRLPDSDTEGWSAAYALERADHRPAIADVRALADAHRRATALAAGVDPRFASLSSELRRKLVDLAEGRIRQAEVEERRLLHRYGWRPDGPEDQNAQARASLTDALALASREAPREHELRSVRTTMTRLANATGIKATDAGRWVAAHEVLSAQGGALPAAIVEAVRNVDDVRARLTEARRAVADGEQRLAREAAFIGRLLLGEAAPTVGEELRRELRAVFRDEQDRIATDVNGGRAPATPEARRTLLLNAMAYRPLDYAACLRPLEALRDSDRERMVREHEAYRRELRTRVPAQPGPEAPEFDGDGYLAQGLHFTPRDERVWINLGDQDRITDLYHRVMAKSLIRHDVIDWPYYAAYREAGQDSGDELHFATLRGGGSNGPIVAAVALKRSPAGHFRPERIMMNAPDWGAYFSLVILVMSHELAAGGSFMTLGQTSQGTKLRDFGTSFMAVQQYTKFHGLVSRALGFERIRRRAFRQVHLDRILEVAALPPEERDAAAKRHGIRWHI